MHQLMSASPSFHPNAFPSVEKASFSWSSIRTTARPGRQLRYTNYRICYRQFADNLRNTGILSQEKEHLLHALPLQTVTTDSGSEGSASPSSSVEYAGILEADQGARQSLLYTIGDWYARARNQYFLVTSKQVLEKLKTELQTAEKIQVLQEIKSSRWTIYGMHSWGRMQAWIKWPIAIFLPWFLFISAFYGTSVSMDLLPFWIIGPLMASIAVKAGIEMCASCRQWVAERKLKEGALQVIQGVRTGHFPLYLVEVANSRYVEVKLQITKRTSDLILFIRSGEIIVVLRQYMYTKLLERWELWADRLEDWRLVYLRLERTLKNIV